MLLLLLKLISVLFFSSTSQSVDQNAKILFDLFKDKDERVNVDHFLGDLRKTGLTKSDPRFKRVIGNLYELSREVGHIGINNLLINEQQFKKVIKDNVYIICQALQEHFVIPDFPDFCKSVEEFYWKCKSNGRGHQADYIPQLAKMNPG